MGAESETGGYSDYNHNFDRDQLFTVHERVYYFVNPSAQNAKNRHQIWELDLTGCFKTSIPASKCIKFIPTRIEVRPHGIMFSLGTILLEWIPSHRNNSQKQKF